MSIFGGNTGKTYADIQRRRKIAEQLRGGIGNPKNVGEGLNAIGSALMSRMQDSRADKARDQLGQQIGMDHPIMQSLYGVPKYRLGTDFHPGGMAVVGENGPELLNLPRGSQVIPNPDDIIRYRGLSMGDRMLVDDEMKRGAPMWQTIDGSPPLPRDPQTPQIEPEEESRFLDDMAYQVADASGGIDPNTLPSFAERAKDAKLDLNVTQAQRTGQALRLLQAESILRDLESQGTRTGQRLLEILPDGVENLLVDEDYGKFQQARDAFAEAAMRADTGATINESEWPRILKNLMPQPGDGPERLAQRRAAREVFIQSLMASSGDAQAIMPEIGKPVVPVTKSNPAEMSDEDLLRALQGGG